MTSNDENLYRGDPPSAPPQYGAPPHGYGPPQGYAPPQGYGPPVYPQAGYGAPGYPPPSWGRPTNTMAILALVLAFVFPPAGLILGIVARRQIRQTGEDGDGLALAGIIAGGIITGFYLLIVVLMIMSFAVASSSFAP
jgi:hypothetical protein